MFPRSLCANTGTQNRSKQPNPVSVRIKPPFALGKIPRDTVVRDNDQTDSGRILLRAFARVNRGLWERAAQNRYRAAAAGECPMARETAACLRGWFRAVAHDGTEPRPSGSGVFNRAVPPRPFPAACEAY